MIVVEIGANAFEVQNNGKCLFAGTKDGCNVYLSKSFVEPVVEKPKKKARKKKAAVEGGDA